MPDETHELAARDAASDAYHEHPNHPSSCPAYTEHAEAMGRNTTTCPCERDWRDHCPVDPED